MVIIIMEIKIADGNAHGIIVQIVINNKQIKMIGADITNKRKRNMMVCGKEKKNKTRNTQQTHAHKSIANILRK
jgi:hypothetical protein